jgi:hypothetical protein
VILPVANLQSPSRDLAEFTLTINRVGLDARERFEILEEAATPAGIPWVSRIELVEFVDALCELNSNGYNSQHTGGARHAIHGGSGKEREDVHLWRRIEIMKGVTKTEVCLTEA